MRTIWKFPLEVEDAQIISVPFGTQLLSVQAQYGTVPCIWGLVPNDTAEKEKISILTVGTGHPIDTKYDRYTFLGTYQLLEGGLVFHVFYQYNYPFEK